MDNSYSKPVRRLYSIPLYRVWQLGAYVSFWCEIRLFTDRLNYFGPYLSPALFYLSSIALCLFSLLYFFHRPTTVEPGVFSASRYNWSYILLILGSLAVVMIQAPIIAGMPVERGYSDVIPILQTYVSRFISGEIVYKYIQFPTYQLFPNHLPMQWLPYVLAQKAHVDYRSFGLAILLLGGFGCYQWALLQQQLGWVEFVFKSLLPFGLLYWIIYISYGIYEVTVETTIVAYYCMLAASVYSRSAVFQAIALAMCLLSRYSVIFWVPLYLLILWREAGRRHTFIVVGLLLITILCIYIGPFLSKDPTIFANALREYRIATIGEWTRSTNIFQGVGFASWFHTYAPGDLNHRITLQQQAHVLCSVSVVLLCGIVYWRLRSTIDYRLLAIIALKFYLATFYAFLQVPYTYLTSLVLFMSIFVVLAIGGTIKKPLINQVKALDL